MQFDLSIKSAVLLGLAALSGTANAVCAPGEVGVGVSQLCGAAGPNQNQCGGNFGAVFVNNCGRLAINSSKNKCAGGYGGGVSVKCNGNDVTQVYTPGGTFGRCYKTNQRCDNTNGFSSLYGGVQWCCKNNNS